MGERGAAAPLNLLMKVIIDKITGFIKTETVLSAAMLLALVSMLFIPPDAGYIHYIDIRTRKTADTGRCDGDGGGKPPVCLHCMAFSVSPFMTSLPRFLE